MIQLSVQILRIQDNEAEVKVNPGQKLFSMIAHAKPLTILLLVMKKLCIC